MSVSFPVEDAGKSLRWAVLLAILIDLPFFLIIVFLTGEFRGLLLLIAIFPMAISGLIIYSSYASSKMSYVLGDNELKITFPLSPLTIGYSRIRTAGKVETSLRFRLFGGSLPGSHWGLFTTSNLGRVQVYATRYKGEFVLIELDDMRILLSPQEPDALIEALSHKTAFAPPTMTDLVEPKLDRRLAAAQLGLVAIVWLAFVFYVLSIYPSLPEIIPVHFGLNGIPNRYGSKVELLLMVAVSGIFPLLNTIFVVKFGKYNKGLSTFLSVVFLLAIALFILVVNQIQQAI